MSIQLPLSGCGAGPFLEYMPKPSQPSHCDTWFFCIALHLKMARKIAHIFLRQEALVKSLVLFVWCIWVTLNGVSAHEEHFNSFTYEVPFGLKASLLYKTHSHVIVSSSDSIYLHSVMKSFSLHMTLRHIPHERMVILWKTILPPLTHNRPVCVSECVISFRAMRRHYPISLCSISLVSFVFTCVFLWAQW